MFTWDAVSLKIGAEIRSRTGATYIVSLLDGKGIEAVRPSTGSTVRCSRKAVERAAASLAAGETLHYQRNASKGGISYTVAVESLAVACLAGFVIRNDARRCWTAA